MKKDFHTIPDTSNTKRLVEPEKAFHGISPLARERLQRLAPEAVSPLPQLEKAERLKQRKVLRQMYPRRKTARLPDCERKARKRARSYRTEQRQREKLIQQIEQYAPNARPTIIRQATWILGKEILYLPTPRAVTGELGRMKNKLAAATIRIAALGLRPDGTYSRTWESPRARAIAAFALGIYQTASRIETATGKKRYVCRGVPLEAWREFLSVGDQLPGEKTVGKGRHKPGGNMENGQVGYLRALQEAGFCYAQKIAPLDAARFEKAGPSGYACLRYWVISPDPDRAGRTDADRARLRELRAEELAAQKAEKIALCGTTVHTDGSPAPGPENDPQGPAIDPDPRPPP